MAKRGLGRGLETLIPVGVPEPIQAEPEAPAAVETPAGPEIPARRETPPAAGAGVPQGLAEIGLTLRSRREKRRLSLDDVQDATKVRKRYLVALELGDDASSPGDVYFRGFLKIYADFLGLDGAALVRRYKAAKDRVGEGGTVVPSQEEPAGAESGTTPKDDDAALPEVSCPGESPATTPVRRHRRARVLRLPFLVFLLALIVLAVGSRMLTNGVRPAPAVSKEPSAAGPPASAQPLEPEPPSPQQPDGTSQAPSQPPAETPELVREDRSEHLTLIGIKADELTLSVAIKDGPCWVRVEADGAIIAEELLGAGARREWKANRRLVVRVGAPWTMSATLNGADLGVIGPRGGPAKDLEISIIE